jgi:3-oxoacyl-(acyl-carrier-protein) synthase
LGYIASKIASGLGNIEYLTINSNACASGAYAIHEAYDLIHNKGFEEVIVYGEEWVEPNEELLYKQLKIPIIPSDGFVILKFAKKGHGAYVNATSWIWNKEKSPFYFSKEGYSKAMSSLGMGELKPNFIKLHGTGTEINDRAELGAVSAIFGTMEYIRYKDKIGHSQGVSGALELAMVVKEHPYKTIICNSAGLGNFYGSVWIET